MINNPLSIATDNIFVIAACILALVVMIVTYKKRGALKAEHLDEDLEKVTCKQCGAESDIDSLKCGNCGEEIQQIYDFKECYNCGEIYDMKYKKCPYCTIVGYVEAAADEDSDRA